MVSTSGVVGAGVGRVASEADVGEETGRSAVSWGAIIVGALAATAATLVLVTLGTGLGLSMVSPWENRGASAVTVGIAAIIWFAIVHWLSSAVGGYLTGRLRSKWVRIHTNEVSFRDRAHGFLAWSLATVVGAFMLASLAASGVGGAAKGVSEAAVNAGQAAAQNGGFDDGYYVDMLLRTSNPVAEGSQGDFRAEMTRILARNMQDGQVSLAPEDRTYIAQRVAAQTGSNQADAEARVDSTVAQLNKAQQEARAVTDEARKRAAQLSIVTAIAMAIGAIIAATAAAWAGRKRDQQETTYGTRPVR